MSRERTRFAAATHGAAIVWRLLPDEAARRTWDVWLESFDDRSPYQLYGYGEQMRAQGWQPLRWACFAADGGVRAMMQGNLKRYPLGSGLVWSPGAPVGDLALCGEELREALRRTTGCPLLYCRFRNDRAFDESDAAELRRGGWSPARSKLTSNRSLWLDPCARACGDPLPGLKRNWRRNLRRAEQFGCRIRRWLAPDADEAAALYREMEQRKNLVEQYSIDELRALFTQTGSRIVLYRCDDERGELLAFRGAFVFGARAWDLFAATNAQGRERGASYLLFVRLVEHLRACGVRFYDLGGIDPQANPGVYRFKQGTGAQPLDYLGEWDWASAPGLRFVCDSAIRHRAALRRGEPAPEDHHAALVG